MTEQTEIITGIHHGKLYTDNAPPTEVYGNLRADLDGIARGREKKKQDTREFCNRT
jgi:hypothetical protein